MHAGRKDFCVFSPHSDMSLLFISHSVRRVSLAVILSPLRAKSTLALLINSLRRSLFNTYIWLAVLFTKKYSNDSYISINFQSLLDTNYLTPRVFWHVPDICTKHNNAHYFHTYGSNFSMFHIPDCGRIVYVCACVLVFMSHGAKYDCDYTTGYVTLSLR